MASIALSPGRAASRAFSGAMKAASRNVRWTIVTSILLIFGSFISAAVIQMRMDRTHALDQAALIESQRAQELASNFAATFDRYAALGTAFANSQLSAETSAALSDAGGPALQNIAVLDGGGQLAFELKRPPKDLLPLNQPPLAQALSGRVVFDADRGRSIVLAFSDNGRIVLVQLASNALLLSGMADDVLATFEGRTLALGRNWRDLPSYDALALPHANAEARILELQSGRKLVSLARVPEWPVTVGASVQVGDALSGWYGALPLYFFFILGPAFAGAGLAVVFVRELERRTRTNSAVRALKSKRNDEAKLLIRLADAERRAVEAERSKSEFITHMSHELRTPLNAIIGFSEVIEQGLYGQAGHPKYAEYAHDISQAGRSLHAKIHDVLEFANLEAGRQPIRLTRSDVTIVTRQAIEEIAGRAFSRKIRISVSLPENAEAVVDAQALKRALNNLLANALQFTHDGGAVRVQMRMSSDAVILGIQDNGFGFSQSEASRAGAPFLRFERPGSATGTGLGLAIASSLIRRMGGALNVSGKPGDGALAEIRLRRG
jgi:signal transduction histidine kinase